MSGLRRTTHRAIERLLDLEPGAVLTDAALVAQRAVDMAVDGVVDGVPTAPRSICIHGDTPGAVAMARRVRAALTEAGVRLGSFA